MSRRCPSCGEPGRNVAAFCGRCGARREDARPGPGLPADRGAAPPDGRTRRMHRITLRQAGAFTVTLAVVGVFAAGLEFDDAVGAVNVPSAPAEADADGVTTAARPDGASPAPPPELLPCADPGAGSLCLRWQRPRAPDQLVFADADAVYLGAAGGALAAIDRLTGEVRWTTAVGVGQLVGGTVGRDGLVVAGTGGPATGDAVAGLDPGDGAVRWTAPGASIELDAEGGTGLLFEPARLRHLDPATGEERWSWATIDPAGVRLVPGTAADPIVSSNRVLSALDLDTGGARWEISLPQLRGAAASGPDRLVAVDGAGGLIGIDAASGVVDWESRLAFGDRSAVRISAAAGVVVVVIDPPPAEDGTRTPRIVAVDPESGEVRWVHLYRSTVERRGLVLDPPAAAILVGTSTPGTIAALDLASGRIAWQKDLGTEPAHVRVVDDTVLAASGRDVALLSAADGDVRSVARAAAPVIGIVAADTGSALLETTTEVVAVVWSTGG